MSIGWRAVAPRNHEQCEDEYSNVDSLPMAPCPLKPRKTSVHTSRDDLSFMNECIPIRKKARHSFQLPWKFRHYQLNEQPRAVHVKLLKPDAIPSVHQLAVINSNVSDGECHSCQNEMSSPGLKKLKVGYPAEKNEQWSDEHDSAFAT